MLSSLAQIGPSPVTKPFWDACLVRELRVQRCTSCQRFRHPPLVGCPHCGGAEAEWPKLSGRGRIYSFTVVHHPAMPTLTEDVPYAVVVVELDDAPGVRLISNMPGVPVDQLAIGMQVEVAWDDVRPDLVLPRFRAVS